MRYSEIVGEASGSLSYKQACVVIASDDELFQAVLDYRQNYESGIAEHPEMLSRFVAILERMAPVNFGGLYRGECRSSWRDRFGRGFHSWTVSVAIAKSFHRDCAVKDAAELLQISRSVRAIKLDDITAARETLKQGETYFSGNQGEVFVYDPDAVKYGREIDPNTPNN